MSYLQITGDPRDEYMVMEVIDNLGKSRLCHKNKSKYPLQVSHATATYTNDKILACGGTHGSKFKTNQYCKICLQIFDMWCKNVR